MKQELHDLVDAVRGLGLMLTGAPAPKCVRISGNTANFAERLERLQRALESFDASVGSGEDKETGNPDLKNDPEALKKALDGLLRLIQVKGVNLAEADAIVRDALGLVDDTEGKKKKGGTLPTFRPSKLKKKKGGFKPRMSLFPDRPGEASLNDLKKIVHELNATSSMLGATVANGEVAQARSERKKVPPPAFKR